MPTVTMGQAIKTGELQELSEQFILDCATNPKQVFFFSSPIMVRNATVDAKG